MMLELEAEPSRPRPLRTETEYYVRFFNSKIIFLEKDF